MTTEQHQRIEQILEADLPHPERCRQLLSLVAAATPAPQLRRETWERRPGGVTLCIGSDFGLLLGLDFPAGETAGPVGAWLRSHLDGVATHWRLRRGDAAALWLLLCASQRAQPQPAAGGMVPSG